VARAPDEVPGVVGCYGFPIPSLFREARRQVSPRLQERLTALVHFRGKELTLNEIICHQARVLAAHLKGTVTYRPFMAKW